MGAVLRPLVAAAVVALGILSAGEGAARLTTRPLFRTSAAVTVPLIEVTPGGVPHILYPSEEERVRHAWREDGTWRDEPVDTGSAASVAESMAVDADGRVHALLSAFGWSPDDPAGLAYGVRDDAGWTLAPVAEGLSYARLSLDPDGLPRIFGRTVEGERVVDSFDGSGWTRAPTGLPAGSGGNETQFVVDATGSGHALYGRNFDPYYATDAGGAWTEAILPADVGHGTLAVDAEGRAHIVAEAGDPQSLEVVHLRFAAGAWERERILSAADTGNGWYAPALRTDPEGHLFAGILEFEYRRGSWQSRSRLGLFDGESWRVIPLGGRRSPHLTSLARGPDGALHGAFVGPKSGYLCVALPDLEARWEGDAVEAGDGGSAVRGTLIVRNRGAGRSRPVRVAFHLSEDGVLDEGDPRVGPVRRLPGLRPGREVRLRVRLPLPENPAGRRLLAVVDPDRRRPDIDRPNNLAAVVVVD